MYCLGFSIGGAASAVAVGKVGAAACRIVSKHKFPTPDVYEEALRSLLAHADALLESEGLRSADMEAVGVSCAGPLDSRGGVILSPPNLPGWDNVEITELLRQKYGVPAFLQNDANACAVAEWKYGAGRGCRSLVYLTFTAGMGAGLILDGRLYRGACDMAGELGHVRMEPYGPVGYGKSGSFEGFCSGGGLAQLARSMALERIQLGDPPAICENVRGLDTLTAKVVSDAAEDGDPFCQEVYRRSGEYLGRGLAILVDLLNPEKIIVGGIYPRSRALLYDAMMKALVREALPRSLQACAVEPAELGESLSDVAALCVAAQGMEAVPV